MACTKVQLINNIVGNVFDGASFTGVVTATPFSGSGGPGIVIIRYLA